MGLLKIGRPLSWDEAAPYRQYVRRHGVLQFTAEVPWDPTPRSRATSHRSYV